MDSVSAAGLKEKLRRFEAIQRSIDELDSFLKATAESATHDPVHSGLELRYWHGDSHGSSMVAVSIDGKPAVVAIQNGGEFIESLVRLRNELVAEAKSL